MLSVRPINTFSRPWGSIHRLNRSPMKPEVAPVSFVCLYRRSSIDVSGAIDLPAKKVKTVPLDRSVESVPMPAPTPTYAPPYPPPVKPRISAVAAYPPTPVSGTSTDPWNSNGTTGTEAPELTMAAAPLVEGWF